MGPKLEGQTADPREMPGDGTAEQRQDKEIPNYCPGRGVYSLSQVFLSRLRELVPRLEQGNALDRELSRDMIYNILRN